MAKRVSTDEKLSKIVNFFKSTNGIYNIKELEKRLSKECGISSMIIPDLIKNLVDENMISMEKCGASNVYWCFENQKHHFYACETEKALLAIESYKEENKKKKKVLEEIRVNKKPSAEKDELLKTYNELLKTVNLIKERKKQSKECSYSEFKKMKKEIEEMKKTINLQTDNIFTLQGYVNKKYGMDKKDFASSFGIPADFDYY